jgi:hypothetical protein
MDTSPGNSRGSLFFVATSQGFPVRPTPFPRDAGGAVADKASMAWGEHLNRP